MKGIWMSLVFAALVFSFSSTAMSQWGQEEGQEGMETAQTRVGETAGQQSGQVDPQVEEALQKAGDHLQKAGKELRDV